MSPETDRSVVLLDLSTAIDHLSGICFKTGPPALTGVELEWTVHDAVDPWQPVSRQRLHTALGDHSPATLGATGPGRPLDRGGGPGRPLDRGGGPGRPLDRGGTVSVEPGGQVEISTPPQESLVTLAEATDADIAQLAALLARCGLVLGRHGIDPYRTPQVVLDTPRYVAMRQAFDRHGPAGRTMMHSTAGLQICLDAGEPDQLAERWAAIHQLGPPLVAAFATSARHAGQPTDWASARMAAWLAIDPFRTRPVWTPDSGDNDPVGEWARYALAAPLLCVRADGPDWSVPPGISFADWLDGALPRPPTVDDLDYHLSTLFPPVRPRGYLEIRYLDGQPAGQWFTPVAVLSVLLDTPATVRRVRAACAPAADRWHAAARKGLADPVVAAAAAAVLELARNELNRLDLPAERRAEIDRELGRRITAAERGVR